MTNRCLATLAGARWHLYHTPNLAAMRSARSPEELVRLALVPAGRHLAVAIGLLPAELRSEAAAALLAYRVLRAYDELGARPVAAVVNAMEYLNGDTDTAPVPLRDGEAVDLVLTERIRDVREVLSELPFDGRERICRLLIDLGRAMAHNLEDPLPRIAYGERVLGRVMLYVCELVAEEACAEADISELAGCLGVTVGLVSDLRSGQLVLSTGDREEQTRAALQRALVPVLGSIALLARLGPCTHSRAVRVALAYLTMTTTGYLCAAVKAPAPHRRPVLPAAAVLASMSDGQWAAMLKRVRCCLDGAIHGLLDASPHRSTRASSDVLALGDPGAMLPSLSPLIVGTTFALVEALPEEPLTGELPEVDVRRMMIADHLAFGALERLRPPDADGLRDLAAQFQLAALDPPPTVGR